MTLPKWKQEYNQWRREAAKQLNCTIKGIDAAIAEGRKLLTEMRQNNSPMYEFYKNMPMYQACLLIYIYCQNPLLKLMSTSNPSDWERIRAQVNLNAENPAKP